MEQNRNTETIQWIDTQLKKQRFPILVLIIEQVLISVITIGYAFLFRNLIDSIRNDTYSFRKNAIFLLVFFVVQVIILTSYRYLQEKTKAEAEDHLKIHAYVTLLRKKYEQITDMHSGQWLNRLTSDTQIVADGFVSILPGFSGMMTRIIGIALSLFIFDKRSVFILIPGGISMIVLTLLFRKHLKDLSHKVQETDGDLRSYLQEQLENVLMIKVYDRKERSSKNSKAFMDRHLSARMNRTRFSSFCYAGFSAIMNGTYILSGIYGVYLLIQGKTSYGTLTALLQLISLLQSPLANVSAFVPRFYTLLASGERLMEIDRLEEDTDVLPLERIREFYEEELLSFGYEKMSFSYDDGEGRKTIGKCDIEFNKGEFVAISGQSGCGKTTLLKLMMGLYPLDEGSGYLKTKAEILPLSSEYRNLFAYIPQDNVLMSGSIEEIVTFEDDQADLKRLDRALHLSVCDEFVSLHKDGLNTRLKERGLGLSQGQLQRLNIARAIYSGRPVLLMDEADSALDEETCDIMLQRIREEKDLTVVFVTHNEKIRNKADKIICCKEIEGTMRWMQER